MNIRTVIVDDEPAIVSSISKMLKQYCQQIKILATATDYRVAKEILRSKPVDLVFLDIKLGGDTSFQLLRELMPIDFQVIFITAFDQYALEAFKFSAVDYLLKPVEPNDLVQGVLKAEKAFYMENLQLRLKSLLYNMQQSDRDRTQTVVLRTMESFHVVQVRDILFCEAKGNYTEFHLRDGTTILVSQTLKKYDLLLSKFNFYRCHQSHLVNLAAVLRYNKKQGGSLVLKDGFEIPVASRRKEQLLNMLNI